MKFVAEDKGKLFLGVNDEHAWRVLGFEEHPVVVLRDLDTGAEKKLDYADDWPYLRLEPKRQYRKGENMASETKLKPDGLVSKNGQPIIVKKRFATDFDVILNSPTDHGDEDLVLTALGEMEDKGLVPPPVLIGSETRTPDGTLVEGMTTNQQATMNKVTGAERGPTLNILTDQSTTTRIPELDFEKAFGPDRPEAKPMAGLMERMEADSESIKLCRRLFPDVAITHLSEIEAKLTATQRAELYKAMSEEGV